uniref:Uncharacterized protein n=1 Tax=Cajanus cajan TaxID=3821 RepID=A0A151RV13_CAJCA|nr:hypothetical protein KK1_032036 [Cajanus cajan]
MKVKHYSVQRLNSLLCKYSSQGLPESVLYCYASFINSGHSPDQFTYAITLSASAKVQNVELGRAVHCCVIKRGLQSTSFCQGALIHLYAKCNSLTSARTIFDAAPCPHLHTVSWTALLSGYVQAGMPEEALHIFDRMRNFDAYPIPDPVALVTVLNTYISLGKLHDACQLFEQMPLPNRNVVAWNVMISGYAKRGHYKEALAFFHQMSKHGVKSSRSTLASVLSAIASLASLDHGLLLHARAIKQGFESSLYVASSLINMYGKCEMLHAARQVFDAISRKNMIVWNAMLGVYSQNGYLNANLLFSEFSNLKSTVMWTALISGHTQNECSDVALNLYREMLDNNILPDQATFVTVLRACALLSSLHDGREIHSLIFHTGFDTDELTNSALIDMYAKCGDVKSAAQAFEELAIKKDVISWNSMIVGFAKNGYAESVLRVFDKMTQSCINPDDVTFLGVLTACSHAGWVYEGRQIFDIMVNYYGIEPKVDHYACMVDLLGRWGFLKEAEEFIDKLEVEPNAMIWANLLGACRIHGDEKRGQRAARELIKLEPQNSSPYVLLSNMYAASGHWDEARSLRRTMIKKDIQKMPGCSWIVVERKTNLFVAGDISHPSYDEISQALKHLTALTKDNRFQDDGISRVGQI